MSTELLERLKELALQRSPGTPSHDWPQPTLSWGELDMIIHALSSLALAERGEGWQPIETAPKDGTMILAAEPKNSQRRLVVYHDEWAMWMSVPGRIRVRPTHWMPLPPAPASGRGA